MNDDDGLALALDVGGTTLKAELGIATFSANLGWRHLELVRSLGAEWHCGETAEIGHLAVRTGARCACGRDGCLEAIASAAAIARRYTGLSGSHGTGAHDVAARLNTDAVARQAWPDAVEALADGLGDGGGVIGAALLARDGWAPES